MSKELGGAKDGGKEIGRLPSTFSPSPALLRLSYPLASNAIAALCPAMPLTPPPRSAPAPARKIWRSSVSAPHRGLFPALAPPSTKGKSRSRWKILPRGSEISLSKSSGDLTSTASDPSWQGARADSMGSILPRIENCAKCREVFHITCRAAV
jgi:hypothetical protein